MTNGLSMVGVWISIVNAMLPALLLELVPRVEAHLAYGDMEASLLNLLLVARMSNSAVIYYLLTTPSPGVEAFVDVSAGVYGATNTLQEREWDHYVLGEQSLLDIQSILISDAFVAPILRLAFGPGLTVLRQVFVAPFARTQGRMNSYFDGVDWHIAERYTDMIKTVFVSLFYLALLPSGAFVASFAFFASFAVDKYCLFRWWKVPPKVDAAVGVLSLRWLVFCVLVHLAISLRFFAGAPFVTPDLCRAEDSNGSDWRWVACAATGTSTGGSDSGKWSNLAEAFSSGLPALFFPSKASGVYEPGSPQESLTRAYLYAIWAFFGLGLLIYSRFIWRAVARFACGSHAVWASWGTASAAPSSSVGSTSGAGDSSAVDFVNGSKPTRKAARSVGAKKTIKKRFTELDPSAGSVTAFVPQLDPEGLPFPVLACARPVEPLTAEEECMDEYIGWGIPDAELDSVYDERVPQAFSSIKFWRYFEPGAVGGWGAGAGFQEEPPKKAPTGARKSISWGDAGPEEAAAVGNRGAHNMRAEI
jgi:hypothetical protein